MSVLNGDPSRDSNKPLTPWLAAKLDGYALSKFIAESIVSFYFFLKKNVFKSRSIGS